jgi:H+/Cl- antiporter ClcA
MTKTDYIMKGAYWGIIIGIVPAIILAIFLSILGCGLTTNDSSYAEKCTNISTWNLGFWITFIISTILGLIPAAIIVGIPSFGIGALIGFIYSKTIKKK